MHSTMTIAISIGTVPTADIPQLKQHLLLGILQRKKRDMLIVSVHPGT